MKKTVLFAATLLALATTTNAYALSLTIENKSKWEIHEMYFSPGSEKSWGEDQLGEEIIKTGEAFKLTKIAKGNYDVKFVDEDGDQCVVSNVDFRASEDFKLTDDILLGCQGNTDQE